MTQIDVLKLLFNILIVVAGFRLCLTLVPLWALGIIGFILLIQSQILSPTLVASLYGSSSPLITTVVPFLVLLFAFHFLFSGLRGKR